ncbi:RNA exonuclease 4 [Rhopalosiphum maidis]|uniref:RNA exonuclease 4 n=1 Tax=Rhopalosiphum maidis TaxID=43146 RepID=UPI000EFF296E|nr:RNA exonuclease 4 [Rhopalosiphum maidis]XP_026819746.1 RNA exonuclease 4 [Rhopalosiphum maidis]
MNSAKEVLLNKPENGDAKCVNNQQQSKKDKDVLAIDCEMVGIGQRSALARVSIVNSKGETIYDKFVKPRGKVTDYRTRVSGIRPQDIANGELFAIVKTEVHQIVKQKILVGHGLEHDLVVLELNHPLHLIRDTSTYWNVKENTKVRKPSLKLLASRLLGVSIQDGEHSSVEDAKVALQLYMMVRKDWENRFIKKSSLS